MKFRKFKEKADNFIKEKPFEFGFISGLLLGVTVCSYFAFQTILLLLPT